MKGNFEIEIDTKFIFDDRCEERVGECIEELGYSKVLLLHDDGKFLQESGLLDTVVSSLQNSKINFWVLSGILPNPRLTIVEEGISLVKEHQIDLILAIGGGSVIDTAKAIGIGAKVNHPVWDFFEGKAIPKDTVAVSSLLTYPSAGSESSCVTVINNTEKKQKLLVSAPIIRPRMAFMNPRLTYSLPGSLTALGIVDMFSHICERYFSDSDEIGVIDRMAEGALKTIVEIGPLSISEPNNYFYRSELMWLSTIAQNNTLGIGRSQDWATHEIANELSALYDTPHGITISIIMPAWLKYVSRMRQQRVGRFAVKVFDVEESTQELSKQAEEGITALEAFFKKMKMPVSLREYGLTEIDIEALLDGINFNGDDQSIGSYYRLNRNDCREIIRIAY
ncbi:iron-containing alcohol dehydrogenase [Enterococcus sp. HY326]|uniref:iron-containing alcohol dehydrogenase n=1 Tax=Enterococcus sp. HY326 TaxID=2971265 RepID=UPI00224067B8|nr:iron-containing alcohol dehydrogenase [Enterococcus sp. HY326]